MSMFGDLLNAVGVSTKGSSSSSSSSKTSLYEETMEMLAGALTMYIFADLRDMARDGALLGDDGSSNTKLEQLEPPLSAGSMLKVIKDNKDALVGSKDYVGLEETITTLEQLYEHSKKDGGLMASVFGGNKEAKLVQFVDTNAKNEMVHAITINDARKRVTVIFRGSVTDTDFITDAKVVQTKVENPVYKIDEKTPEKINIHSGFHEYLTKKRKETGIPRLQEILSSITSLLQQNPTYSLYLTGHSLGGALATLCGFYAAADPTITSLLQQQSSRRPVRIISFASPYVGNAKFLISFQSLERRRVLQHLRVCYEKDVVTLMPFASPKIGILSPAYASVKGAGNLYKHCGMKLRFLTTPEDGSELPFTISYPRDQSTDESYAQEIRDFFEDGKNILHNMSLAFTNNMDKIAEFHGCDNYEAYIQTCRVGLMKHTIDNLYNDKEIIGNMLDPDYEPKMMTSATERIERIMNSDTLKQTFTDLFNGK